jgi:heme/copper-type cytochrome/quinol oxidase subunit 2
MNPTRTQIALTRILSTAVLVLGGSSSLFACPMCFGAQETALVDGTKLGMLVLLFIVLGMQAAFAGFFLYLRRRAKRIADLDLDIEWSELQGGASK